MTPSPLGITPAYAGKTALLSRLASLSGDHPRVCGENTDAIRRLEGLEGSPPRMRGKQISVCGRIASSGITPAYAGKTSLWLLPFCGSGDHPRVCGENSATLSAQLCASGSPPRMRGKRMEDHRPSEILGITPAYAGKTDGMTKSRKSRRDHPRVCGENRLYPRP